MNLDEEARQALNDAVERLMPGTWLWIAWCERRINRPLFDWLERQHGLRMENRIQTPHMALRKLNEPVFLYKIAIE